MEPIQVWPWDDAPADLKAHIPNSLGDWVAVVPTEHVDSYCDLIEAGSLFGKCELWKYELAGGSVLYIGAYL